MYFAFVLTLLSILIGTGVISVAEGAMIPLTSAMGVVAMVGLVLGLMFVRGRD